jgi:molybdopterin-guanine dinucleotide biosynthesis protein A
MVRIAVEKLRTFCASVSIVGAREDLAEFAPVVRGERGETGPAAGMEAGLKACDQPWAMFTPVDVPLVPVKLLRVWAEHAVETGERGPSGSYLMVEQRAQPTFCMVSRGVLPSWSEVLDQGERRLELVLARARIPGRYGASPVAATLYAPRATSLEMRCWFSNVNTAHDLEAAELLIASAKDDAARME